MFGELFERIFRLDESEETIRAVYKVYKDHERGLDPEEVDLDVALRGLERYYVDYINWWERGAGRSDPGNLKKAYRDRLRDKVIALDNAINQWHVDYPVIAHLEMELELEGDEDYLDQELMDAIENTTEILRRLGRLPEESPYVRG